MTVPPRQLLCLSLASNLGPLVAVNSGPSVAAYWARYMDGYALCSGVERSEIPGA